MRNSLIILAGISGLLGGLYAGYLTIPDIAANPTGSGVPTNANSAENTKPNAFDLGDNVRISRFFTGSKEPVALKKRTELFEALRACTAADMPGLIARVQAMPYTPRWELMPMILERWFQLDLAAARQWVRAKPDWIGMAAWAKADPRSLMQDAADILNAPYLPRVFGDAITNIAPGDPAAQAALLAQIPAGSLRTHILQQLVLGWSETDPALAYASLEQLPPGKERDQTRLGVLCTWADRDPVAVLAQMDALLPTLKAGVLGNELVTKIAERIGGKNTDLALDWISKLPVEFRIAPAISVARIWAAHDPEAVLDWCVANGVDVARGHRDGFRTWGAGVLGEAIAAKPEATISWIEALPAGNDRDWLLEKGLDYALWRTPKGLLFDGENPLWTRLFQQLPEEGQVRLADNIANERMKLGELTDLGAWIQNFSSPAARARAIAGAFNGAFIRDATTMEPLLASLTSISDRDAGLNAMVGLTMNDAPASAATKALAISNEASRRAALESVMTSWQKRDADASRAWLEETPSIPASWKMKWLSTP